MALALLVCAAIHGPLRGGVVINEFLASNVLTNFDEDYDSEDWVELFNDGLLPVRLEGYYLSDDPLDPLKWRFPDVTIPPRGYLLVWLSGKDRFVPPPTSVTGNQDLAFDPVFVKRESTWRYLIADPGAAGPPPGWAGRTFNDAAFREGRAGFGYGDGDDATDLPEGTNAVFTRIRFRVEDPSHLHNLVLRIDYDDGFVAYLNGRRVAASNAPAGDPDFSSVATGKHEAGNPELFDLTPNIDALVAGENVLAVVGLNDLPSSDMSLHPELGVVPLILHTNFRLDRDGESILLTAPDGTPADGLAYPPQTEDHSYGRGPDGGASWYYFVEPTPGGPNPAAGFTEPIADRVEFTPPPGMYAGPVTVVMSTSLAGRTEVRYTTDGREPTLESRLYTGPIEVERNTVFRVAGFIDGQRVTRIESASFFIGGDIELPVLSISMDPDDYAFVHNTAGARGRSSERPGFFEFFEPDGTRGVAVGFGLRLHGGAGRNGDFNTKKAYKAYFRGIYGATKLRYPIIPETPVEVFDKLVLRSGFNDSFRTNGRATYLRDELIRDLYEDMGALAGHGSWCVLYVNMKFRGLYNIVERLDEEFLSSYREEEDWDVIKTGNDVLVGSNTEWNRLHDFAVGNDLSRPENYARIQEMLDLENFTSYMILNIWAQNHDWPHNNWYAARPRTPNGRWIFLSWDAEFGIGLIPSGYSSDSFDFTIGRGGYIRDIFVNLLANAEYRRYFINEFDRYLATALRPELVQNRIAALEAVVAPDIPEETAQFGKTFYDWANNVRAMDTFAQRRGPLIFEYVQNSSRYSFPEVTVPRVLSVTPSRVVNTGDTRVRLSGLRLEETTRIRIGGLEPADYRRAFGQLMFDVTLPFTAELSGPVAIEAIHPETGERSVAEGLLEVLLPVPVIEEVEPPEASVSGGDTIQIRGRWFLDGVEVYFGGVRAPQVERAGGGLRELVVVTPPGDGEVDLVVVNTQPARLESAPVPFVFHGVRFVRGDANSDGIVDVSDPLALLFALFRGDRPLSCPAAADADASGTLGIADAVKILAHLFQDAPPLVAPYPGCGSDPVGLLPCERGRCP